MQQLPACDVDTNLDKFNLAIDTVLISLEIAREDTNNQKLEEARWIVMQAERVLTSLGHSLGDTIRLNELIQ